MIVQIYEIQDPGEAERCAALGVDCIGSVLLSEDGWQQPEIREAGRVTRAAGRQHSLIPLFRDPDLVCRALDYYRPDFVHFCDALTDEAGAMLPLQPFVELQRRVWTRFPDVGIMRSIPVPASAGMRGFPALALAKALEPLTDRFLIDAWIGNEKSDAFVGITGKTADRALSAALVLQCRVPVILAGGLSAENVRDAIAAVRPAGVDSCTLTNVLDGAGKPVRFRKDFGKVGMFVAEARRAYGIVPKGTSSIG